MACLRARWDPHAWEEAKYLVETGDIVWEVFTAGINREQLGPLLYARVKGKGIFPEKVEQQFRHRYYTNLGRNLILQDELQRILLRFHEMGVNAIVLKGLALAAPVYGNLAVRPMCDLDMLIPSSEIPAAVQELSAMGYDFLETTKKEQDLNQGALSGYSHHEHLHKSSSPPVHVELHRWLLGLHYYQKHLPTDWFWETAVHFPVGKAEALTLGPEAMTLHLCAHLCFHHGGIETVRGFQDIAEVIHGHRAGMDWPLLLARARQYRLSLCLRYVLSRLEKDWHLPVPSQVQRELNETKAGIHERLIFAMRSDKRWYYLRILAQFSDCREPIRFLGRWLFPSRAYIQQQFPKVPAGLWPLCYVLRPLESIARNWRQSF